MSEMVNMAPPWQGMTRAEVSHAVAAGERPLIATELASSAPIGWFKLMEQCWDQKPTNRPDFDAIHDALTQVQGHMNSEGAESEASSRPKTIKQNPLNSETEMITHSGNDELMMELQSVTDNCNQEKQNDTNNNHVTIV